MALKLFDEDHALGRIQPHPALISGPARREPALFGKTIVPDFRIAAVEAFDRKAQVRRIICFDPAAHLLAEVIIAQRVVVPLGVRCGGQGGGHAADSSCRLARYRERFALAVPNRL